MIPSRRVPVWYLISYLVIFILTHVVSFVLGDSLASECFGTLCLFHFHGMTYEDGTGGVFRYVGI